MSTFGTLWMRDKVASLPVLSLVKASPSAIALIIEADFFLVPVNLSLQFRPLILCSASIALLELVYSAQAFFHHFFGNQLSAKFAK